MQGQNATQHRTIPRHLRIQPYDRSQHRKIMGYELNMDLLANVEPIPIGSVDDLCDYVAVCHSPCTRKEGQNCSQYPILYEELRRILDVLELC